MKKQKRQILVLFVLLILLGAVFCLIRWKNKEDANQPQTEAESIIVMELVEEEIVSLSYDYEGETYSYEKIDDVWYLSGDPDRNLTQYSVNSMALNFCPLKATQKIENVTDMSQYGFSEDAPRKVSVSTKDATYTILIGDMNELTENFYVKLPNEDDVYVVDYTVVSRYNRTPDSITVVEESTDGSESDSSEDSQFVEVEESLEEDPTVEKESEEIISDSVEDEVLSKDN